MMKAWKSYFRNMETFIDVLFILLVTCWSITIGYSFGINDQQIYIPFLKAIANESLYPNDLMISQLNNNPSYFYHFFSFLTSYIPIEWLFFVFQFFSLFFTFLMVFYLAKLLLNSRKIAFMSVLLFLIPIIFPGGLNTFDIYFSNRNLVIPLILLSIYFFLKDKYYYAFLFLGISFNFHPIESVLILFIFVFYMISNYRSVNIRNSLYSIVLFIILAFPMFLLLLKMQNSFIASYAWIEVLKIRVPYLFPFSNLYYYISIIPIFLIWLISFKNYHNKEYYHKVLYFTYAIGLLCVIGTIFTEIIPISTIWKLQLFRSTRIFVILAIPFIINYLIILISTKKSYIKSIYAFGFLISFFLHQFIISSIFAVLLFISTIFDFNKEKYRINVLINFKMYIAMTIALIVFGLVLFSNFPIYSDNFYSLLNGIFLSNLLFFAFFGSLFYLFLIFDYLFRKKAISCKEFRILAISCIVLLMIAMPVIKSFQFSNLDVDEDWKNVQLWSKNNTPNESMFIVPPYRGGFRMWSDRAIYSDWYSGALSTFSQDYALEWWERMKVLGYNNNNYNIYGKEEYGKLNESDFRRIKDSINSSKSYVIVEKPKILDFKLVYESKFFYVYEIN